jgi:hypothetical protein
MPENLLSGPESELGESETPFSSDCMVLHISGPDVTDLNFIDLPGSCSDVFPLVFNTLNRSHCRESGKESGH